MTIDSHQHFWRFDRAQYPWIPPSSPLERDWLPEHAGPLLRGFGIEGCIAVQARQTAEETRWLLELADHAPLIKAVVGWVDLCSPTIATDLKRWSQHRRFRGVRHVAQDEPDDRFLVRPEVMQGIGRLEEFGLVFDLLIYSRQLQAAIELVRAFPNQVFVLDHIAKPAIARGELSPWQEEFIELARSPNVFCKLSGMVTEANHQTWQPSDLGPFLDVAFQAFGADRLMYGSDWPVCLLAASYQRQLNTIAEYVAKMCPDAAPKIFGATAKRAYGISP